VFILFIVAKIFLNFSSPQLFKFFWQNFPCNYILNSLHLLWHKGKYTCCLGWNCCWPSFSRVPSPLLKKTASEFI
jgi:hypothetical protein